MAENPTTRRQKFEADIAEVRVRTTGGSQQTWIGAGLGLMVAGALIALISFFASGSISDTRDVLSALILAVFGLSLTVVGGALFVHHATARFLRFWMLRFIYEQQADGTDSPEG